ncbi:DUF4384 domain-containing protein [Ruegeria sp. 2012CJ41-6]|uniref:DUF4384 domain-containing protein n=1 Tax=Ruegeria spongiae TaxID=2942209 RepID=A0ABT0Q529_9RHOB|nr:DUF4384 domain-containing protein [Ruegeria spongiae]MCL6284964.1 DUF4384 domain-containing protein [Ruegeria spongiae]
MTRNPLIWLAGIAISLLAHLAAGFILLWSLDPDTMPDQPVPESRMQLSAYRVERSEARSATPESEAAAAEDASGARLGQGAIPRARAKPVIPTPEPTRITKANSLALSADATKGQTVQPAFAAPQALSATPVPAAQIAASRPADQTKAITAAAITALPLANRPADAQPLAQTTPPTTALPATEATPVALSQAEPTVTRAKAALAFSGSGEGPVDPVSLAAFQSFMAPEAAGDSAAELRDGIAGILAQIPCARMQVQFEPATNTLQLVGHVPEDGMRAPVLQALRAQMGADIAVADTLLILPRPQCGALTGIAGVGLPQSTDQITNPLLVGEDTHAREFRYMQGQQLILDLTAPDYDAYLYVDYFDAKGQVIHLSPNDSVPLTLATAKSALRVGAERPGDSGLYITIGPPYGQEIAVAFAASQPLYDDTRPLVEPAGPYLDWMKARVAEARAKNPEFKGEWVYFFVSTAAQ